MQVDAELCWRSIAVERTWLSITTSAAAPYSMLHAAAPERLAQAERALDAEGASYQQAADLVHSQVVSYLHSGRIGWAFA